ncbi:sensor histidine kinase [Cryptosporangium arvum]|uniref:Signal transduction histidine kinase n=1 Tax=Cryptosporangium arvum DSM 44712 TaxID=927661 RepID=A0A010YLX7_9ACTN|nr:histidine kinase [Cryptosporangium arvum]EXG81215.1 signal transduction histidine kinase [Cryptosporangium arvum DSM 44712]
MSTRTLSFTEPTQGRLRRLNLVTSFPPLVVAAAVLIVLDTHAWWHPIPLAVGVGTAIVAFERWTANDLRRFAVPLLAVAGVVWVLGVLVIGSPNAYWGAATVGSLAVPQLPRRRLAAFAGLLGFVAGVGALRVLVDGGDALVSFVVVPAALTTVSGVLCLAGERFYDVVRELEASRAREAELAVIRERVRFAGDLHDIQGHTLHVVKLKATLARKLVRDAPERAEEELREIHGLVSDTIQQTKDLAYAQRRLNLAAEVENAKNLFEAAGIRVRVTREAEADARVSELLGQVLRETTTNILRHAQATRVRIVLAAHAITIVNDGAAEGPPELRGLSALRRRVAEDGGSLTARAHAGEFTTEASFR